MNPYSDIGQRLRQIREKMSQRKFAERLGISFWTYITYEKGLRPPSFELLMKLREEFFANINWILTGEGRNHDWMRKGLADKYYREDILRRYGGLCVYCRIGGYGVDRILIIRSIAPPPKGNRAHWGKKKDHYDDLVVLCPNCNALFNEGHISAASMRLARDHALESARHFASAMNKAD